MLGGLAVFFGVLSIVDGVTTGSWVNVGLALGLIGTAVLYRLALRPHALRPTTLLFLIVQLGVAATAIHTIGGFLSHAVAFYTLVLVGGSFILSRWRWIMAATGLTILTALILGILELLRVVPPNPAAALLLQTPLPFQILALASQGLVILGVGAISGLVMHLMAQREEQLDAARAESAHRALELATLAHTLEATNTQLEVTQTELRGTVEALTVAALPVGDGILVLPLIGVFDPLRAHAVVERVLEAIYAQRAHTVIVDLTGVSAITPTLSPMLVQCIDGVGVLGAQVVLVGLRPDLATALVRHQFNQERVRSEPTLALALRQR